MHGVVNMNSEVATVDQLGENFYRILTSPFCKKWRVIPRRLTNYPWQPYTESASTGQDEEGEIIVRGFKDKGQHRICISHYEEEDLGAFIVRFSCNVDEMPVVLLEAMPQEANNVNELQDIDLLNSDVQTSYDIGVGSCGNADRFLEPGVRPKEDITPCQRSAIETGRTRTIQLVDLLTAYFVEQESARGREWRVQIKFSQHFHVVSLPKSWLYTEDEDPRSCLADMFDENDALFS